MNTTSATKSWYVIYSKPREEELAVENLERQGYTVYLPRIITTKRRRQRYIDVVEPMFARYLFIYLDSENDNWAPIRSTYGVSNIVQFGGVAAVVPEKLIEFLRGCSDENGLQRMQTREFCQGDEVRVIDGVLAGMYGLYEKQTSQERAIVLLDIAGKHTQVSISRHNLNYA